MNFKNISDKIVGFVKFFTSKVKCACKGKKTCSVDGKCCCCKKIIGVALISVIISIIVNFAMSGFLVKRVIQKDPKMILTAIENMYKNEQKQQQQDASKKAPEVAEQLEKTNGFLGNPNASNVIVEFFDYACGHCKRQTVEFNKLLQKNRDVKIVLADLPILSEKSLVAAQVGAYIAINNPSKLDDYYTLTTKSSLDKESLKRVLRTIGLDVKIMQDALKDQSARKIIEGNYEAAKKLGIQGTPALIVNGKYIPGAVSADDLKSMLK